MDITFNDREQAGLSVTLSQNRGEVLLNASSTEQKQQVVTRFNKKELHSFIGALLHLQQVTFGGRK